MGDKKVIIEDRLLSENAVMKSVQKALIEMGYEPLGDEVQKIFTAIENTKTAYDVDAVVEQLELKAELFSLSERDCCFAIRQNVAIDIVRNGGKE